jgi:hypothetical protein
MPDRSLFRRLLPFAILLLFAVLAAVAIVFLRLRGETAGDRPVVFIHSPSPSQEIPVGRGVMVHATAHLDGGLARLELWADSELADQVNASDGNRQTGLVLATGWEPATAGYHLLTVRAIGAQGEEGEATIAVVAVESGPGVGAHTVGAGETVASIAADYGTSPDEVSDLNPSLPSTGPAAGDSLVVPLDFLPSDDPAPAPVSEAEAEPEPPAVAEGANPAPEETTRIRLEALGLEVDAPYEGVHCYVSVGLTSPAWIPDADHDPVTDESFAPLGGAAWDIASHYSEDAAPSFPWPSDQPLPFEMSCVGVRGGGSDAVELGRVALSIPSSEWDGVTREAESEPGEGRFRLAYRVGPGEIYTLDLDPGMLPPFNLRLDERRQSLRWEYEPPEPAEGVRTADGFLVFLNDGLVWTVGSEARESRLPDEWFTPPCNEEYVFTVRAFVDPYPEGPYSMPSNEVTIAGEEAGPEGCTRDFLVTFTALDTRDLGGDGDRDPGDMGPVYGGVYVNDIGHEFDGRCPDPGFGEGIICGESALSHNTHYDMARLPWVTPGAFGSIFVEVHDNESLMVTFSIADEDTGWNNDNDLVCDGGTQVSWMELERGDYIEETVGSDQRGNDGLARCAVSYTVEQVGGPVGSAGGGVPLPWLDIVDRTVDPETGQIQVHVRNTGTAAWANHDLTIQMSRRGGGTVSVYTWPQVYLDPGAPPTVFTYPYDYSGAAANMCMEIDPRDEVVELYEVYDVYHHGRICPLLPDLILEDVQFDEDADRLLWTVRNEGEGEVEDVELDVRVDYGNRAAVLLPAHRDERVTLAPWESIVMEWPGSMLDREDMLTGFTLTVDPNNEVVETVEDNNSAEVRSGERLRFELRGGRLVWYPLLPTDGCTDYRRRSHQGQTVAMQVFVESPTTSRRVASWTIERNVGGHGYLDLNFDDTNYDNETYVAEFDIAGWEWLRVGVSGELSNDSLGSGSAFHRPEEDWGSEHVISSTGACQFDDHLTWAAQPDENDWWMCGSWRLEYSVCELAP